MILRNYLQKRRTYLEGETLQRAAWQSVLEGGDAELLGFDFEAVVTLGNRADLSVDLNLETMEQLGLGPSVICEVSRGGEATLHSPGQLVVYPIVPLRRWGLGVREYVDLLLDATRKGLLNFDVQSEMRAGQPGLFTAKGKIASIGIRVERGVTQHGLAINVSNDLALFQAIRVCGVLGQSMDRVGGNAELQAVFERVAGEIQTALLTSLRIRG